MEAVADVHVVTGGPAVACHRDRTADDRHHGLAALQQRGAVDQEADILIAKLKYDSLVCAVGERQDAHLLSAGPRLDAEPIPRPARGRAVGSVVKFRHLARPVWYLLRSRRPYSSGVISPAAKLRHRVFALIRRPPTSAATACSKTPRPGVVGVYAAAFEHVQHHVAQFVSECVGVAVPHEIGPFAISTATSGETSFPAGGRKGTSRLPNTFCGRADSPFLCSRRTNCRCMGAETVASCSGLNALRDEVSALARRVRIARGAAAERG